MLPTAETPVVVIEGDCLEVPRGLPAGSVDAVVTDPPYGLSFMGMTWDHGVPGVLFWSAVLRVLKPGGYMLAMGGTRTYHRLACVVEDAGFEIRDCLMWVYGTGFPKGKGCLKPAWEPILLARKPGPKVLPLEIDSCRVATAEALQGSTVRNDIRGGQYAAGHRPNPGDIADYEQHPAGRWPANVVHDGSEEVLAAFAAFGERAPGSPVRNRGFDQWREMEGRADRPAGASHPGYTDTGTAARFFYCAKASRAERDAGLEGMPVKRVARMNAMGDDPPAGIDAVSERCPTLARNHHPTVKPVALMRWLVRLVTPPGGLVLDPFAGSGTTGVAAVAEGRRCLLIEREPRYAEIARRRTAEVQNG